MSPGPAGNKNAVTHGLRMELNELPADCSRIRRERYKMRRVLEDTILERDGTISPYQASTIQTAIRWSTHSALAARWLRIEPDLTIEQKLALSRDVARASESRDRCLKLLGLDKRDGGNTIAAFYDASPSEPHTCACEGNGKTNGCEHANATASHTEPGKGT